ncbi:hypothetical protein AAHC03_020940 [Spirometra sp. Aus1]
MQDREIPGTKNTRSPDKVKLLSDMTDIELGPSTASEMKDLISLHDRHILTANLDDNLDEDQEIEAQTKELTQLFSLCHRQLGQLSSLKRRIQLNGGQQNEKLATNVISSIARTIQELSTTFRKAQSQYLNRLKTRDERIRGYLNLTLDSELTAYDAAGLEEFNLLEPTSGDQTQQLLMENTAAVTQREQEITQIVRSIHELNEIFRDVAQLVVDQGTLVDRIDYNVEQTQVRVQEALKQLTKAQSHQRKNRKLLVIFILACLVMVLGSILLVTKFFK